MFPLGMKLKKKVRKAFNVDVDVERITGLSLLFVGNLIAENRNII